ncbi:uncharacterized protein [Numenius arquata]|uniref:uncharacterized protein n=1 Tax=Numenius arquata TaxID=31919 RepID=UPI003D306243
MAEPGPSRLPVRAARGKRPAPAGEKAAAMAEPGPSSGPVCAAPGKRPAPAGEKAAAMAEPGPSRLPEKEELRQRLEQEKEELRQRLEQEKEELRQRLEQQEKEQLRQRLEQQEKELRQRLEQQEKEMTSCQDERDRWRREVQRLAEDKRCLEDEVEACGQALAEAKGQARTLAATLQEREVQLQVLEGHPRAQAAGGAAPRAGDGAS